MNEYRKEETLSHSKTHSPILPACIETLLDHQITKPFLLTVRKWNCISTKLHKKISSSLTKDKVLVQAKEERIKMLLKYCAYFYRKHNYTFFRGDIPVV
jgi:hypothetical protein